jgi:dTDP-4-dehydrorhamnose 3,5-epimerase
VELEEFPGGPGRDAQELALVRLKFTFSALEIPDVRLVVHERIEDARGSFAETFRADAFAEAGLPPMLQDNLSRSVRGVVRGMHYQLGAAPMGKLVRCARGAIFDVAVDIRRGSPNYGTWVGVELTEDNQRMLWVPRGFAHGFAALSETADVFYKMDAYYSPGHDRGFRWNDPAVGIAWPIASPLLSSKDEKAPLLADADNDFVYRRV